jgi:hypothetical protein
MAIPPFLAFDATTKLPPPAVLAEIDKRYPPAAGAPVSGTAVFRQRYAKAKTTSVSAFQGKLGNRHATSSSSATPSPRGRGRPLARSGS